MKQTIKSRCCCIQQQSTIQTTSISHSMMRPAYPFAYFPMYFSFYC